MLAHTKKHRTSSKNNFICVTLNPPNSKAVFYFIPLSKKKELKDFLEKQVDDNDESVEWSVLAKNRLEKYKKAGLVLRGMRYREGLSQKQLAVKSGVTQNEISNIENGKRTVGKKIAEKLANVLNFDYKMLLE